MRKKHTTENAGGASVAEKIAAIHGKVDDLQYGLHRLNCFATITDSTVCDMLFAASGLNDKPGFYYCGEADRKVVGFAANEALALSNEAEATVETLLDDLRLVLDTLKHLEPVRESPVRGEALHGLFRAWEQAYASWVATREQDGHIPDGTPEHEAERRAALALAAHPCTTPDDVRRKSSLFLENRYLRDSAQEFAIELLASVSGVKNL